MAQFVNREVPIDRIVTAELESEVWLGGDKLDEGGFFARPADQPIGFRLRQILDKLGRPATPELALYEMFEVWLVPHRVAIIRRSGKAEATSIGMQIEYLHSDTTCSVISMIPA